MIIGVAIDRRLRKILRRVDQVSWGPGSIALINARWPYLAAPFNPHVLNNGVTKETSIDLLVERKNYPRVDTVFAKRFGKSSGNVGQSAGLGERHNFR